MKLSNNLSKIISKYRQKSTKNEPRWPPWTHPGSESVSCPLISSPRVVLGSQRCPQGNPKIVKLTKKSTKSSDKNTSRICTSKSIENMLFLDPPKPRKLGYRVRVALILTFLLDPQKVSQKCLKLLQNGPRRAKQGAKGLKSDLQRNTQKLGVNKQQKSINLETCLSKGTGSAL